MRQLRALLKEMPICAPFCRKPSCYCAILKAGKQNLHNLTVAHSSTSQVNISQEQYITALELFIEQIKFPCNESGPLGNFERLHGQTRTQEECVEGFQFHRFPHSSKGCITQNFELLASLGSDPDWHTTTEPVSLLSSSLVCS